MFLISDTLSPLSWSCVSSYSSSQPVCLLSPCRTMSQSLVEPMPGNTPTSGSSLASATRSCHGNLRQVCMILRNDWLSFEMLEIILTVLFLSFFFLTSFFPSYLSFFCTFFLQKHLSIVDVDCLMANRMGGITECFCVSDILMTLPTKLHLANSTHTHTHIHSYHLVKL